MPGADAAFATAQRALWAFEHGLDEQGLSALVELQKTGQRPPSLPEVEKAAARSLIAATRIDDPTEVARELLLRVDGRSNDALRQAKNSVTPAALRLLLEKEAAQPGGNPTDKSARSVANVCRKWAADAMNDARRRAARQALLGADEKSREFVWRQAIQWPRGPTRTSVVADIKGHEQADGAARYIARWLEKNNATLQIRSAETLGELGSPKALPALEAARAKLRATLAGGGGGGGATRGYVAFLEQQSYVSDFDVEIATAAAIADPKISVVQSGVVLDATVAGISWERWIIELSTAIDRSIRALR
jgi:hypothetical protein